MANQPVASPSNPIDESQNPGPEGSNLVDEEQHEAKEDIGAQKSVFAISEPIREDQVQNAVNFLSHPKVRGSLVIYKRSFLERKGLTREEIDEAFRRVPFLQDPPSNATSAEATAMNHVIQPSSSVEPVVPTQSQQLVYAPRDALAAVPSVRQSRFHWSQAFLSIGLLAASGAAASVLFKNAAIPRLKSWIRKVVEEEYEIEKYKKPRPALAEEAVEAAKEAASAAAVVATASQELLNAKNEERKFFEDFVEKLDAQVEEMKMMGNALRTLENSKEIVNSQDKQIGEYDQSKLRNRTTNSSQGISEASQSNLSISFNKQEKVNGINNTNKTDSHSVRPSSSLASIDPPHPKSYMEIIEMVQRGEKPPNIKEINDMPPNPDQPIPKPLLAPRPKPWEVMQQQQSNSSYVPKPQFNGQGLNFEARGNRSIPITGSFDNSEPWRRHKAENGTEAEPQVAEPKWLPSATGSLERLNRSWKPPQPPELLKQEAAIAIREPDSPVQKQQLSDESAHLLLNGSDQKDTASDLVVGSDEKEVDVEV
ncbi:peroxisomal membrane protein PEX14 isoform X2 [Ananas comosus]|uniref:Peroxisomal membrane protein PEX14 n=1 Tax=Ananas comosus TaxID=4615 RepID=A0A6P5FT60_ANACO|nr:peroxisomal membrane protein PEX14 isoform X2 [Ananas comosus]